MSGPAPLSAVCFRCGEPKDLALGRCPGCGAVPAGADRELAVLCSIRVLDPPSLAEVQARLRRGEPLRPSHALREQARAALRTAPAPVAALTRRQVALLLAGNLVLTPLLGFAAWYRLRTSPGPAGRQALATTLLASGVLVVLWGAWRLRAAHQLADLLGQ